MLHDFRFQDKLFQLTASHSITGHCGVVSSPVSLFFPSRIVSDLWGVCWLRWLHQWDNWKSSASHRLSKTRTHCQTSFEACRRVSSWKVPQSHSSILHTSLLGQSEWLLTHKSWGFWCLDISLWSCSRLISIVPFCTWVGGLQKGGEKQGILSRDTTSLVDILPLVSFHPLSTLLLLLLLHT